MKKLKLIFWPFIYLILIISVCVSFVLIFRSYYYRAIFVSGSSMNPTLNGNVSERVDYGIIDAHDNAIKRVKRFQIITTYYPFADSHDYVNPFVPGGNNEIHKYDSSYKIKRVYAFPGETFKFVVNYDAVETAIEKGGNRTEEGKYYLQQSIEFHLKTSSGEFEKQNIKFKRNIDPDKVDRYDNFEYTLGKEEYWVMGDNYQASSDCFSKKAPIYYENIVGVLVAIEGTCKIQSHVDIDSTYDGTKVSYKCTQRKRHMPVYY